MSNPTNRRSLVDPDPAEPSELRYTLERLNLALEAGNIGTWEWDVATGAVVWDPRLEAIWGFPPGGFGGTYEAYVKTLHPEEREWIEEAIRKSVETGTGHVFDHRILRPDGTIRWIESRGRVVKDAAGGVVGMIGTAVDVTERKLLEQEREERLRLERRNRRRWAFLAEASMRLASSLDYEETLAEVANLLVPKEADWCVVEIVEGDGRLRPVTVAHTDPSKVELARTIRERYPADPSAPQGSHHVIRTGEPELVAEIPEELLAASARDPEHLAMLKALGLRSYLCVPLAARGRVLGAISLVNAESGRAFDHDDLELAGLLATRAAMAIDNAMLYRERSHVAWTLQASLLPSRLPDIPGIEAAARYTAAAEAVEVGGDFYDLFEISPGRWGIVAGDVCGKGAEAAALTALVRHTLRALALQRPNPSEVLRGVNQAIIRAETGGRFCTVVYGELRSDDRSTRIVVSSGGHPLPLVVRQNGTVDRLGRPGTLLGVFENPVLQDDQAELEPGDALIFYTDGVTEERRAGESFGETRLLGVLGGIRDRTAEGLVEAVEGASLGFAEGPPRDDMAILAIRIVP